MSKCAQCSKGLSGSWNMTKSGNSYDQTGRYLGISDGYFLYSGSPNWVYCYCLECWKKQVLSLGFVQQEIQKYKTIVDSLPQTVITELQEKKTKLSQEIQGIQTRLKQLKVQDSVIQNAINPIQQEINKIQQQIAVLSNR